MLLNSVSFHWRFVWLYRCAKTMIALLKSLMETCAKSEIFFIWFFGFFRTLCTKQRCSQDESHTQRYSQCSQFAVSGFLASSPSPQNWQSMLRAVSQEPRAIPDIEQSLKSSDLPSNAEQQFQYHACKKYFLFPSKSFLAKTNQIMAGRGLHQLVKDSPVWGWESSKLISTTDI